jgi:transglutaminase-like putative cysteine protease
MDGQKRTTKIGRLIHLFIKHPVLTSSDWSVQDNPPPMIQLQPTAFLDFDHPAVQNYVATNTLATDPPEVRVIQLYYAIRDDFWYNPYQLNLTPEGMRASTIVSKSQAYCVEKAILLAAGARFLGIPSRLFFGDVRNHIATEKLQQQLQTDVMAFHGGTELFLQGKWVKATPAFNRSLCEKLQVEPLDFDGVKDSIFQEFDKSGRQYMEYLHFYGVFDDLPYALFLSSLQKHYPFLAEKMVDLKIDLTN